MLNQEKCVSDLLNIVKTLLELPKDMATVKPYTDQLAQLYTDLTGIDTEAEMRSEDHSETEQGVAISPVQAARCLKEPLRTQVFIQGVYQAIEDALDRNGDKPVSILYAGTGPYGLLLLPVLALMKGKPINSCLIDIHDESIESVKRVIEAFGISESIHSVDRADACEWEPKDVDAFDIIISETMTNLLAREPQIFIFAHLQQYLKPDGTLIPQEISLSASLVGDEKSEPLGEFYCLNQDTAKQLREGDKSSYQGVLTVPNQDGLPTRLKLDTDLKVYKEHVLEEHETSLSIPVYADQLYFGDRRNIPYHYEFSDFPKFVFDTPHYKPETTLTPVLERGDTGLIHLKRFWHKIQLDKAALLDQGVRVPEFDLDLLLTQECEGDFQKWLEYGYQQHPPCFQQFEQWVVNEHSLTEHKINAINEKLQEKISSAA